MNNKKPIMNNTKPIEIVQEVENAWEQEVENQEQEIQHQIERTDEEGIYVAEAIAGNSEDDLTHQPSSISEIRTIIDPRTNRSFFLFGIELGQCYLTYDNFWTTALWRDGKTIKKITFEKAEEAQDLLDSLESEEVRVVDDLWGWESRTNTKTKNRLKKELKKAIQAHKEGKIITKNFNDNQEWYVL